jgi:hypothetical protein
MAAAPLLSVTLAGCLEFQEQTMAYHHDAKTDTLRIFQVYRGICGTSKEDVLSDDEQGQLHSVLTTERTFFFSNWILEHDKEMLKQLLADIRDPEHRGKDGHSEEDVKRLEPLFRMLVENIRVENGPLYLDANGQLCGVQFVTVSKVSELIRAANAAVLHYAMTEVAKASPESAEKAVLLGFLERGTQAFRLQANEFSITLPMTRSEFEKIFIGAESPYAPLLRAGLKANFADNEVTLTLGTASDSITTLTAPMSKQPYHGNAVADARKHTAIREEYDAKSAMKGFLTPER